MCILIQTLSKLTEEQPTLPPENINSASGRERRRKEKEHREVQTLTLRDKDSCDSEPDVHV